MLTFPKFGKVFEAEWATTQSRFEIDTSMSIAEAKDKESIGVSIKRRNKEARLSQNEIVRGISRQDIEWLAQQLADEASEATGEKVSHATALSEAVGCTYAAARMWLTGESMPRRHEMIRRINELIESRYPLFQIRVTRADLALLELMAGEMKATMGHHGQELATRIQNEIDRVRALLK